MANDKIGLQAEIQTTARGLSQRYDNELRQLSAKNHNNLKRHYRGLRKQTQWLTC